MATGRYRSSSSFSRRGEAGSERTPPARVDRDSSTDSRPDRNGDSLLEELPATLSFSASTVEINVEATRFARVAPALRASGTVSVDVPRLSPKVPT